MLYGNAGIIDLHNLSVLNKSIVPHFDNINNLIYDILDSLDDLKAQECEADIFSFDYLLKYIQYTKELDEYTKEFEKLFLAVYLLMERSQKKEYREWYNDKLSKIIMTKIEKIREIIL